METENKPLSSSDFNESRSVDHGILLLLSAQYMVQIGRVVSEISPVRVESQGARLFKQVHLFGKIR